MDLTEKMKQVAGRLQHEHQEAREGIKHRGERGGATEEIVKEYLQDFLPDFLSVGTGEIVTASEEVPEKEQVSSQMDIVIYDANKCPTFHRSESAQVFPVEGVYGVIEVKSELNSQGLEDDIDKIIRAKRMPKSTYYEEAIQTNFGPLYGKHWDHFPILGAIFAFESIELETVLTKIRELNEEKGLELHEQVDLVFALDKGIIENVEYDPEEDHFDVSCRPRPSTVKAYTEDERSLLFFYILLMQHLAQANMNPIKLAPYGDLTDVDHYFGNMLNDPVGISGVMEWISKANLFEKEENEG